MQNEAFKQHIYSFSLNQKIWNPLAISQKKNFKWKKSVKPWKFGYSIILKYIRKVKNFQPGEPIPKSLKILSLNFSTLVLSLQLKKIANYLRCRIFWFNMCHTRWNSLHNLVFFCWAKEEISNGTTIFTICRTDYYKFLIPKNCTLNC